MFDDPKTLILVYKTEDGKAIDLTQSTFDYPRPIENSIFTNGQPWLMLDEAGEFERNVEKHYKAFYMGHWELKNGTLCRVFFQPEPKTDLGHSSFFGIVFRPGPENASGRPEEIYIINGKSAFATPMDAIMNPNTAEVIISQSNHDMRGFRGGGGTYIDGGRAYCRLVGDIHAVQIGEVTLEIEFDSAVDKLPFVDFLWQPIG